MPTLVLSDEEFTAVCAAVAAIVACASTAHGEPDVEEEMHELAHEALARAPSVIKTLQSVADEVLLRLANKPSNNGRPH